MTLNGISCHCSDCIHYNKFSEECSNEDGITIDEDGKCLSLCETMEEYLNEQDSNR